MIDIIFTITLSIHALYVALTVILGFTGDSASSLFAPVVMLCSLASIASITLNEIFNKKNKQISNKSKVLYLFPLLFVFFYLFDTATTTYTDQSASLSQFLSSISYATSGIYIAIFCYRYDRINSILKQLNIVMIIITVAIAFAIPETLFLGVVTFGTGTYQTLAYLSAFSYGINLYEILSVNSKLKYRYQSTKIYKTLSIIMMLIQIVGVFISGGRGGAILLFLYTIILFYILSKQHLKKVFIFALLFPPIIYFTLSYSNPKLVAMIEQRSERTFSYLGDEGLDLSETSGRDVVYSETFDKFTDRLIFGYGVFKQYDMLKKEYNAPYVHNILLEISLQGGLVLLSLFLYLIYKHYKKLSIYTKIYPENSIIIVIYLYAITFLMFSGSYMGNTYFWFTLTYILLYNPKKELYNPK